MREEKGFTLVEVFLAASILTMVLVAVSTLFILAMKFNVAAGDKTECVALAQERMERLRQARYAMVAAGGDLSSPVSSYHEYLDIDANGTNDYLVTWLVEDSLPMAGSKRISVRCRALRGRTAQLGPPKQVTFVTYKAEKNEP